MKHYKSEKLNQLKDLLKVNAKLRKYKRLNRKLDYDTSFDINLKQTQLEILENKNLFEISNIRLYYIAYGILRGKEYKTIENYCKPENELDDWDWKIINDIVYKYEEKESEENVHTC